MTKNESEKKALAVPKCLRRSETLLSTVEWHIWNPQAIILFSECLRVIFSVLELHSKKHISPKQVPADKVGGKWQSSIENTAC